MKKILLVITASLIALTSYAEGYQVNALSAKQLGMGHAGVALKLGAQSLWFNPAAAAYQNSRFDFSAGVTAIDATATFSQNNYIDPVRTWESDNDISTPIYFYGNYKVTEDLAVGVSFNTPYGSSMNWGDDWVGAHLVQDINLSSYTLQPTVSYKFLNDKLSVGVGLMMSWGNFDLSRSLFQVGSTTNNIIAGSLTAAGMGQYAPIITSAGNTALVSAELGGDAAMQMGVNIGLMYDINERWSLGASYRSKVLMKVTDGEAELDYANDNVESVLQATGLIPQLEEGTFKAELPLPSVFSFGAAFRPNADWEFTAEFQFVGWSAYENLNVSFNEEELKLQDINSVKNYSNTIMARFGTQYKATDWMTVRAGFYLDESPVRSDYLNPETPSMTKAGYTCGFSFMPTRERNLSIDISYGLVTSADPERMGSYPYENALMGGAMDPFVGNYTTKAHMLSFGIGLKF